MSNRIFFFGALLVLRATGFSFLAYSRKDAFQSHTTSYSRRQEGYNRFLGQCRDKVCRDGSLYMSVPNPLDTLTSGLASICRLPGGVSVDPTARRLILAAETEEKRPKLKQLYDIENSIGCRKVRERLTELDLVVEKVIPAASNSRVFLDPDYEYALEAGTVIPSMIATTITEEGREQEFMLSGVDEIVEYLDEKFGVSKPPAAEDDLKLLALKAAREIGGFAANILRMGRGEKVATVAAVGSSAPRPKQPLILYSYEGNQFCRLVREVLTELDIVYELRSVGKESPRRAEMAKVTGGSTQCPHLIDPNTGVSMSESADIILYLYKNYALWVPPSELLQWASATILPLAKPVFQFLAPLQAGANKEDKQEYAEEIAKAKSEIERSVSADPVVIYTYGLSPFSFEAKSLLDRLGVAYTEISLGAEWIPGLIKQGGSQIRAALLEMTGQSSLPHIFIGGKSIGGLFSGTPGLVPALENGALLDMVAEASSSKPRTPKQQVIQEGENADSLAADVGSFE